MMTRGGKKAGKFTGVATLLCCALLLAAGSGNYSPAAKDARMAAPKIATSVTAKETSRWAAAYGRLPLSFEENQGQTAREVRYVSHGRGYELFLTSQEAVLALQPRKHLDFSPAHRAATIRALREANKARAAQQQLTAIRLQLDGANPNPQISGLDRLPTRVNYFIGNDPKNWHTGVASYSRVKYSEVYPGVDLVFYGNQRKLEYDFIVAPGADPKQIFFKVDGTSKMRINARGDLGLSVPGGEVELQKPVVYQLVNGQRREIEGKYAIDGAHRVRFTVAAYDRTQPLILDPVLSYATYLGGAGTEDSLLASAIALDSVGDAFVAGQTTSVDFPAGTKGGVVPTPASPNLGASFVAELDPTGANLLYSTYLAGSTTNAADSAFGIAVDSTGKVYVTGETFATNFPTTASAFNPGPVATAVNGTVYLTKLDPTVNGAGALLYSTYVSGTGAEYANCVAADAVGNAYIAGNTTSTDFPTANPLQSAPEASNTLGTSFVTRIDTTKSGAASLIFSTYFGGNGANATTLGGLGFGEQISGIVVDSSQNAYVVGQTSSTDSPAWFITSATAFQATPPAANKKESAFVSKIATTAGTLSYSTYLAGSTLEEGYGIALGPGNVAYVTGKANSSDFPTTANASDTSNSGSGKAFISLLDTTKAGANSLTYSTLLGGTGGDIGYSIKSDTSGKAYVAGFTQSPDFAGPLLNSLGALQTKLLSGGGDGFIAKLNPAGGGTSDLLYATYYGGSGATGDQAYGIAIDSANPPNAFITGETFSTDLPVLSPLSTGASLHGTSDAFVAKLALIPTMTVSPSPSFDFGVQTVGVATAPKAFTVTNNTASTATFSSIVTTGVLPAANTDFKISNDACSPNVGAGLNCAVSVTFTPSAPASRESATLVITATVTNGGQNSSEVLNVNLTGAGPFPVVGLAPSPVAFGNQVINTTSAPMPVTLTNTGTGPLTIASLAASGDFAETSTGATACPITPNTLPATAGSNSCTINVTFTPTALGLRNGMLTVTDNAAGSPHTVALSGTGTNTPDFTLSAAPAAENVTSGTVGAPVTISVNPVNGFSAAVALTCTGAPMNSTCLLSPASITPPTTSTLTFTAHAMLVPLPVSKPAPPLNLLRIVPLFVALMLIFLLRSARRFRTRLAMVSAILICVMLAACSGPGAPNTNTKKGAYPLTVTGTSGALAHNTTVTITVD
ncbi:MAG TPA: SBBP repeat-containing protein [Candidatus Angelobacter sp.]|nr:SBBP repeat-containing protein [Candidatus Angelobacter sp.]